MAGPREFETNPQLMPLTGEQSFAPHDYAPQEGLLGLKQGKASRGNRDLQVVIESDIIPRLMLVHRNGIVKGDARDTERTAIDPVILARFSKLVLDAPLDVLVAFVKRLSDEGYCLRAILLDLCAPVARWLGDQWVADELDFVAVTLSLSRLQQLVREIIPEYGVAQTEAEMRHKRVLILPTPGDQHSFGAVLAAQLFRESGWVVDDGLVVSVEELKELITSERYDIIGFSHATDTLVENLIAAIQMVRVSASQTPAAIIVGGRLAAERPDLCRVVGADLFVKNTSEAVEYSDRLMRRLSHASL